MQIRRIEISAFRCFKNSLVIEDIGDGVTLLVLMMRAGPEAESRSRNPAVITK